MTGLARALIDDEPAGSSTRSGGRSIRSASSARSPPIRRPTADEHRLRRIVDWLDHAIELGASGIALGPIFASRTHGYDTTDHYRIDPRLGDDADFDHLVAEAHRRGLRVLLDGVFNHVGTDFARYRDAATAATRVVPRARQRRSTRSKATTG